jgi:hypothetical protein
MKSKWKVSLISLLTLSAIATGYMSFRYFRKPRAELVYIVPGEPSLCIAARSFARTVKGILKSDFGKEVPKTPLARHIARTRWWNEIKWQLRMWELSFGVPLDVEELEKVAGDRSILALYKGKEEEVFIASVVSSQAKLELTTSQATAPKRYGISKEKYRGVNVMTVNSGFPRRFHYAFIGKLGLLSTDEKLLRRSIDLYRNGGDSFAKRKPEIARAFRGSDLSIYLDLNALGVSSGRWVSINRHLEEEIISENELSLEDVSFPSDETDDPLPPHPTEFILNLYLRTGHINALFISPGEGIWPDVTIVTDDEGLDWIRSFLRENGMEMIELGTARRGDLEITRFRVSNSALAPISGYARLKDKVVIGTPVEGVERMISFLKEARWDVSINSTGYLEVDLRGLDAEMRKLSFGLALAAALSKGSRTGLIYELLRSLAPLRYLGVVSANMDTYDGNNIKLKIRIKEGEKDAQK